MIKLEAIKTELDKAGLTYKVVEDVDISTKRVAVVSTPQVRLTSAYSNIMYAINFTLAKQEYLVALGKIQASEKVKVEGAGRKSKRTLAPLVDEQ